MDFEKQIKNLKVYQEFKNSICADKLSQAYLFLCPDRLTNKILLLELSKLLQCKNQCGCEICDSCVKITVGTHPDVLVYPAGANFVVEDANNIYDNVQIKPMLAQKKIFIINDIDVSTEQAQNKMLKILEEPPSNVIFLISATSQEKVLKTINSRVQKLMVDRMPRQQLLQIFADTDDYVLQVAMSFGDGYIGKVLDIINNKTFLQNFKNMQNLIENLQNSSQIPYFSPYFSKDKQTFECNLLILDSILRDLLMLKLNESKLIINSFLIDKLEKIKEQYSTHALTEILKDIITIKQKLDSNVNLLILADNFLLDFLEIKFICK